MLSIDNSQVLDYESKGRNILPALVAFLFDGTGFSSVPAVTFSGGAGSGAAATAVITNGQLTGVTITNGGTGYTSAPTIAIAGGLGATATATVAGGVVTAITVTNGGTGNTLKITDGTTYPSGDSRKIVNITVADKFGKLKEYHIGASPAYTTIDLIADGFNKTKGIDVLATVVSTLGMFKDGSVNDVSAAYNSGYLTMVK